MWPDAARYIARVNRKSANPPVSVSLFYPRSQINPPEAGALNETTPWSHFTFFTYAVKPGDLQ